MNISQHNTSKELVINWHVTEVCNYSCQYCYAKWSDQYTSDIVQDENKVKKLLTELYHFFSPENKSNPLSNRMHWSSLRLNIAGGEPLIYPKQVLAVIQFAKSLGMNVSLITNGSKLTQQLMRKMAPNLSLFGLSVDSANSRINQEIGRTTKKGQQLSLLEIGKMLDEGRQLNPKMRLKINTVVNKSNCNDDMTKLIQTLKPERWKVLRMLPVVNSNLAVSQNEFDGYVKRHSSLGSVMCVEDNDEMTESYIMIDPLGRFFQNQASTNGYHYSPSILEVSAEVAFAQMGFSTQKFQDRYKNPEKLIAVEMVE